MDRRFGLGKMPVSIAKAATLTSPPPRVGEHYRTPISDTWSGIKFELGRMVKIVQHSKGDPLVMDTAAFIISSIEPEQRRDPVAIASQCFDWVRGVFQYVPDPVGLEALRTPNRMIRMAKLPAELIGAICAPIFAARNGRSLSEVVPHEVIPIAAKAAGDCDDASTLCASLVMACGIRARFRLGGTDGIEGYHHVWAQADVMGNGSYEGGDMDPTEPEFDALGKFALMDKYETVDIP